MGSRFDHALQLAPPACEVRPHLLFRCSQLICIGVLAAVICPVALSPAYAQKSEERRRDAVERLSREKAALERTRDRETSLRRRDQALRQEIAKLTEDLQRTGADIQRTEARLTQIEEKLEKLGADEKQVRGKLSKKHKLIAWLFGRMMLMGRNPPPVVITHPKDVLKMIRSAKLLGYHEPRIKREIGELTADLTKLTSVIDEAKRERTNEAREKDRLRREGKRLSALQETKNQTLLATNKELSEISRTAVAKSKTVAGLSDLIKELDTTVARKTNLGKYNQKLRRKSRVPQQPALPPATNPKSKAGRQPPPKSERKVAALPPSAIELSPKGTGGTANPGRLEPAIPFHLAKARLPLPAHGKKVIDFGDTTAQGGRSKGIVIKTRHNALITSPCDGWVVYAGAFRSYGQLLIINAGGGYHVLLANLSRLDVQLGQFVLAAEPVGSMAGDARGKGKASDPVLYVEFRKDGKPLNPAPWWATGRQRVQG